MCVFFSLSDTIEETNVSKDQKRSVEELESNLRSLNSESALGTWQLCQKDPQQYSDQVEWVVAG